MIEVREAGGGTVGGRVQVDDDETGPCIFTGRDGARRTIFAQSY